MLVSYTQLKMLPVTSCHIQAMVACIYNSCLDVCVRNQSLINIIVCHATGTCIFNLLLVSIYQYLNFIHLFIHTSSYLLVVFPSFL